MAERIINCKFCGKEVLARDVKKKFCSKVCVGKNKREIKNKSYVFNENEVPSLDGEVWLPVIGFEGFYEISNLGRARSVNRIIDGGKWGYEKRRSKLLKQSKNPKMGYKYVILVKNGERSTMKIHRMVAMAFIPNPENKQHVNHKDLDKTNNNVSNLEWVTPLENRQHAVSHGHCNKGNNVHTSVLDPEKVKEIRYIHSKGMASIKELKAIYNTAYEITIINVIKRRFWKHVK